MPQDNPVGLVMATSLEAQPVIERLSLREAASKPFRVYEGDGVVLAVSGIGKACAARAASFLIWRHEARVVVNAGAAGATVDAELGDIYQIERVIEFDRPTLSNRGLRVHLPDTIEGYRNAALATQDVPVVTAEERANVAVHAGLVDMEGAAVVQACRLSGAKCHLFKIVSDTPAHRCDRDIVESIKSVRGALADFLADDLFVRHNALFCADAGRT